MPDRTDSEARPPRWQQRFRLLQRGARNAVDILRAGRLSSPYQAEHAVLLRERVFQLRRYAGPATDGSGELDPILLVPPLMVAADVYDISPEISAVHALTAAGLDVWVVDFGAPEREEGGMDRTFDDHILAVDRAVAEVVARTGRPVHLAGYSQGGMFCYQAAAYRRSSDIRSIVTFGSPVDIHRVLPVPVHDRLAERLLGAAKEAVSAPLARIEGLPGFLTARGFKLLNPGKELRQIVDLLGALPDRDALQKREPRRRFLGGEGFVAWPGPALRTFVEEVVANNRMVSGGLVIHGRSVSLVDLRVPVLCFIGRTDDIARPASVRAIRRAAPNADVREIEVDAGHFGLVVGSRAISQTWPAVVDWARWSAGRGELPRPLRAEPSQSAALLHPDSDDPDQLPEPEVDALYEVGAALVDELWKGLGDASIEVTHIVDILRWQLPRLARLRRLHDGSRVSLGRALAEQAAAIPDAPFFLWDGRAWSYAEADRRVNQVLAAFLQAGVERGERVAILMDNHPDFLTALVALSRLGAIAVLLNADARGLSLLQSISVSGATRVVADPAHVDAARDAIPALSLLVLGMRRGEMARELPASAFDLDAAIDPAIADPPKGLDANPGRARDLAMLMFTSGTTGLPQAARITNRRWVVAALGAASACGLTSRDTVYCCLPLHHATGLLLACSGALVGGARLALSEGFATARFWDEVRRNGATVVFYVGEMLRYLNSAPTLPNEARHPVRLFVGNGLRADVWRRFQERFAPERILEFYASTEGNVVLANLRGDKIGSVGRELPGSGPVALVRVDDDLAPVRDAAGAALRCEPEEIGMLVARIDSRSPLATFDGYLDTQASERRVFRGLFEPGDAWFATGDLLRRDADGDWWFVDRGGDTFRWHAQNVSTEQVEQVLYQLPFARVAAVWGVRLPGEEGRIGAAALELHPGAQFDGAAAYRALEHNLMPDARPRWIRVVPHIETTSTHKVVKHRLRAEGVPEVRAGETLYEIDPERKEYVKRS